MEEQLFPLELLGKPLEERKKYFQDITIPHPAFKSAYKGLLERINEGNKNSVILVYGPTGVGKSKLIEKVMEKIITDNMEILENDPGRLPFLYVEAIPPDVGSFDWKDFYYRSLESANEPLIDYKIFIERGEIPSENIRDKQRAALRRSLENVLINRKPLAFIIDEAQHITMTTNSRSLLNQVNILKSLANVTKVPIVLIGTYDLLKYRDLNDQIIRRGKDIHLQRYNVNKETETNTFINVLLAFQKHLPLEIEPDLIGNWDYFYSRTIGSIGILKDWLTITFQISLDNNPNLKCLTVRDFKKFEIAPERCIKILKEAQVGEKYVNDKENEAELYKLIGLKEMKEVQENKDEEKKAKKSNKQRVGVRSPKRDIVGSLNAEVQ